MHFHIHAGMKVVRRELGTVADYCPLCHEIRSCSLHSVSQAMHVYGMAVEQLELLGHEIRCDACRLVRQADPTPFQNVGMSGANGDLGILVERTQPDVRGRYTQSLALDERMRRGDLNRDDRSRVLLETLRLAEGLVEPRARVKHFDRWSGLGCFMTCGGAALAVGVVADAFGIRGNDGSLVVAGIATLVAFVCTLIALAGDVRRFTRRQVMPHLARALRPLGPDSDEIEAAVRACAAAGMKIGTALRPHDLYAAIAAVPLGSR